MAHYRLGIDVGGTFTDFTLMDDESGALSVYKCPSTPPRHEQGVVTGINGLVEQEEIDAADITYFVHGTTIAVNTVIERNGALIGLLVTQGFRDLMTLGRSRLPDTYNFLVEKPEPLVPRHLVGEIQERMLVNGRVHTALDEVGVRREALRLRSQHIDTLAICFLHAYRNSAHELRAKEIASDACPGLYVCTSAEVWPQMREYERALVTLINAYVGPRMDAYFDSLLTGVERAGVKCNVFITKSNGGVMTVRSARSVPVQTLISGPAAGVSGAQFVGRAAGFNKLIALDMGGTSTEVAVIDSEIVVSTDNTIGDFQVVIPAVDVNSIGAGGGSIAWIDASGVLKVGPKSAGAFPGPACYGLGGEDATITDAYVVLGIIDPDQFLGGGMSLQPAVARSAVQKIASALQMEPVEAAEAILRVATSNMYSALVPLMAQKGVDLSEFSLLTYGGAGPTHGFLLAREVGITRVIVPPHPGTLCALGCLVADLKSDFIKTVNLTLETNQSVTALNQLRTDYEGLSQQARSWLAEERVEVSRSEILYSADMRFMGQAFEVEVFFGPIDIHAADFGSLVLEAFYRRYQALYTVKDLTGDVEIVNARATVVGMTSKPALPQIANSPLKGAAERPSPKRTAAVYLDGALQRTDIYDRTSLTWGHKFQGPAVVYQYDSTIFVPPSFEASVDRFGNLVGELLA